MLTEIERSALKELLAPDPNHRPGKLTQEQRLEMVREFIHDPSISVKALADKYGVRKQTVYYHLKRHAR